MRFHTKDVGSQEAALTELAKLVEKSLEHPYVRATALKIVRDCEGRDDECELAAIYDAVKSGDPAVEALARGFPYRADPKSVDWFAAPDRSLKMCEAGACGGDCDEHSVLVASLAGSLGFTPGLRAYGPDPDEDRFVHVYAVVLTPKKAVKPPQMANFGAEDVLPGTKVIGLDTTVPRAFVGWQPQQGRYKTAWILPPGAAR